MSSIHKINSCRYISISLVMLFGCYCFEAKAASVPRDSIGVEYVNGQKIIIHELKPKETYYGLGRHYNVPVKSIIATNNNKPLKVGDTLRIPIGSTASAVSLTSSGASSHQNSSQDVPVLAPEEYTTYKVGRGETLYTISKRFMVSVETIKRANGLDNETLQEGALLKIPNKELPPPAVEQSSVALSELIDSDSTSMEDAFELPANRYGIREMNEKGIGVWIEDLNQAGGNMLALHKTAPVGTVIKITNPMTNRTTFAKVVGRFTDTAQTKNAIIVISKSAANLIGVLDNRFQVEIAYGTPNEPGD